jgi:hypothetical protein
VATYHLDLDENELKLLLAAIRQVKHTFTIAEAQSSAAGQPLAEEYQPLQEAYARLHNRIAHLLDGPPQPYRIK